MESKENKSNMVFYPDGSKIKINDNNSDKMRLNEMADLIKVFGDSSSSGVSHSKDIFTDCYRPLEKKQRKNHKYYSTRKTAYTALKISIAALSISVGTLVALAIKRIKK